MTSSEVFKARITYIEEQYEHVLDDVVRRPDLQMHNSDGNLVTYLDLPFCITKSVAQWAINFFGEKKDTVKLVSIISGVSYSPEGKSKDITRIELEF